MFIESIAITAFGGINGKTLELQNGLNVLQGPNESGKSTVAECIRYVLYGFHGKPDRDRYTGFSAATTEASLILRDGEKRYRVERRTSGAKEHCGIFDLDTESPVFEGKVPGEVFFGIPEGLFVGTAFVGQTSGSRIDGRSTAEAVENLLFSADEGVSVKKALKRLDEARVALLHKNKKGGRIWELENQISDLRAQLSEATEQNAEILSLESSIASLGKKLSQEEEALATARAQLEDFKILELRRRNQRLAELASAYREADTAAETHHETYSRNGFFPGNDYLDRLKDCGGEIARWDARIKEIEGELDKLNHQIEKHRAEKEQRDHQEELKRATLSAKRGTALAVSVLCCLLFLGAALGTALMFMTAKELLGTVFAIATVLLISGMIGGFVLVSRYSLALRDMEHIIGNRDDIFQDRLERIGADLAAAREERAGYKRMLDDLCSKWSLLPTTKGLNELAWVIGEEQRLRSRQEKARLAYVQMKTEVEAGSRAAEVEDDGRAVDLPEDFNPKDAAKMRDMLSEMIRAKREIRQRNEVRLAQLSATVVSPSVIYETITALTYERDELMKRYESYVLATECLAEAGETMRASVSPRLSAAAGRKMASVTDGKYSELGVDGSFSMTFRPETETGGRTTADERFMSGGTADAAYVSLRLALMSLICGQRTPPMIFDESFARLDDGRLGNMLKLLATEDRQILLFASGDREIRLLRALALPHGAVSLVS